MSPRSTRALLLCLLLAPVAVYLAVCGRYRLASSEPLTLTHATAALRHLRAVLDGAPHPRSAPQGREDRRAQAPKLGGLPTHRDLPLWVTLYLDGERIFRHQASGPDLRRAIQQAAEALGQDAALANLSAASRRRVRIKLDLATDRGPIFTKVPLAFAKSVVPGLDGLGLTVGQQSAYLLPDDLYQKQLLAGHQPFFFMSEFRTGLDLKRVVTLLADELALTRESWRRSQRDFFRFRVQSFVEAPRDKGRALVVSRSRVPVGRINRAMVRDAVTRAADYVLRQIQPDGKFFYQYYPLEDRHSAGDYSLPRHAGTTWFLSLAYRQLKQQRYLAGARRAIDYLGQHAVPRACRSTPYACVGSDAYADLGSAALAVVAIAEYQGATGDTRFEQLARRLGRFIVWMQKDNGDFCHQYFPSRQKKNCHDILLYYTGESALALGKLYELTHDRQYLGPLERALDFLTGEKYDFFMGQFFISEDHWTCIAAEAAPPSLRKEQYARLCYAFARLNRRAQVQPGEGLMSDLHGAFSITPFFMPHNTPAGSRTEANVATYLLSVKRKEPQAEVLDTVLRAVRYLVDQQIRPESAYLMPRPEAALGGMTQTPIRASIRIDYVQHAAAAMARALPLVPEQGWSPDD